MQKFDRRLAENRVESIHRGEAFLRGALLALLLIAFYYLSYRYPLRLNNSRTSPTYGDTPVALQAGKFVLIGGVLALLAMHPTGRMRRAVRVAEPMQPYSAAIWFLALLAIGKGAFGLGFDILGLGIVLLVAAVLTTYRTWTTWDPDSVGRTIAFFAVASVLMNIYEYTLYRQQGRLPALAYENSISVRFGSLLDDPNGYACLIALTAPVVFMRFADRPVLRALTLAGLVWGLILTQSFTGIATTAAVLAFITVAANKDRPAKIGAFILGGTAAALYLVNHLMNSASFQDTLKTKQGSIAAHQSSLVQVDQLSFAHLAGLSTEVVITEVGWIASLVNMGVIWLVVLALVGIHSVRQFLRLAQDAPTSAAKGTHLGFASFQLLFLVASFNLPLYIVFPINLLFGLGLALCILVPKYRPVPAQ